MDKEKRYGWKLADEPGALMWIDKTLINVDRRYQRDEKASKVLEIAGAWSWVAYGVLTIADRFGKYYAVDGQHRLLAALKRDDITKVPCVVFKINEIETEAQGFLTSATNRRPISAFDRFKAQIAAKDGTALYVQKTMDQLGLSLVAKPTKPGELKCIGILCRLAARNRDDFCRILIFTEELCRTRSPIYEKLILGLDYINSHCGRGLDDLRLCERIKAVGPGQLLDAAFRNISCRGIGGERIVAEGFINAVNASTRKKFALAAEGAA